MLPSRCIATAWNDCYLCAACQRTLRHHSGQEPYIGRLHVFMRHHHIRRQVYSFIIRHAEIQGVIWSALSYTLLSYQKQPKEKNMLATLLSIITLLLTLCLAITKLLLEFANEIWYFAESVELHVAAVMQFRDYVSSATIQNW